jgi:hypothetical protein
MGSERGGIIRYDPRIVTAWFKEHGLNAVPEYQFAPPRKWRFDFAFENRVALEVQGGIFSGGRHTRGAALLKEMEKLNTAAKMGWRVLYCIPQNLCFMETVDMVKEALNG